MHVFLRHKMECNIFFRYRTWYIVGRTDSVCAFTEKYILHGDSSRICYLLHVLCRTNQFGVTKFSFFPGTNTLKKTLGVLGLAVNGEMGVRNWSLYATLVSTG